MLGFEFSSGVDKVVDNIGRLPPELFAETCQQIVSPLQGRSQAVDAIEIGERFQKAGIRLDLGALQDIIRLLSFNFRSAAKNNLTADELVTKLSESCSGWTKPNLQVVHRLWNEQGAVIRVHQQTQVMISTGQLVDMQWKLGMAVSSDTCRSLNSPYVSLLLKVADSSGQISNKSFEMTIPQFQNFSRQFKEIAAVLETV